MRCKITYVELGDDLRVYCCNFFWGAEKNILYVVVLFATRFYLFSFINFFFKFIFFSFFGNTIVGSGIFDNSFAMLIYITKKNASSFHSSLIFEMNKRKGGWELLLPRHQICWNDYWGIFCWLIEVFII